VTQQDHPLNDTDRRILAYGWGVDQVESLTLDPAVPAEP
jgi:hypothetical protein